MKRGAATPPAAVLSGRACGQWCACLANSAARQAHPVKIATARFAHALEIVRKITDVDGYPLGKKMDEYPLSEKGGAISSVIDYHDDDGLRPPFFLRPV